MLLSRKIKVVPTVGTSTIQDTDLMTVAPEGSLGHCPQERQLTVQG